MVTVDWKKKDLAPNNWKVFMKVKQQIIIPLHDIMIENDIYHFTVIYLFIYKPINIININIYIKLI